MMAVDNGMLFIREAVSAMNNSTAPITINHVAFVTAACSPVRGFAQGHRHAERNNVDHPKISTQEGFSVHKPIVL
jgi:hypothetical protein